MRRAEPYTSYPDAISYASLLQQGRKRRGGLRLKAKGREKDWPHLSSTRLGENREACTPPWHLPFLSVPLPRTVGGAHTPGGDEFTPPHSESISQKNLHSLFRVFCLAYLRQL